jgi:hypothetical protein
MLADRDAGPARLVFRSAPETSTVAVTYDVARHRRCHPKLLDRHAGLLPYLYLRPPGEPNPACLPIVSSSLRGTARFGDAGRLTAFHCVDHDLHYIGDEPAIPLDDAQEQFAELTRGWDITSATPILVYHESANRHRLLLRPVWMYAATVWRGGADVPLVAVAIPATAGSGSDTGLVGEPDGRRHSTPRRDQTLPAPGDGLRAGFSWLGREVALPESAATIGRASAALESAGWHTAFAWGAEDAWKTDWVSASHEWVDAVELAYCCSHAGSSGWQLSPAGPLGWVGEREIGRSGSRDPLQYGVDRLRWAVVDGCGPLQDRAIGAKADVFENWADLFNGLRLFMGGASQMTGEASVGERFVHLAAGIRRPGEPPNPSLRLPLHQAWLRANLERRAGLSSGTGMGMGQAVWSASLVASAPEDDAADDRLPIAGEPAPPAMPTPMRLTAVFSPVSAAG